MSYRYASPFIYNDLRFRSRLEAQWACYFEALRIEFDYEPTCFTLTDGRFFTPDFYLPALDVYLEVKPDTAMIRDAERDKADRLAGERETGRVWLSHGAPPWFEQLESSTIDALPKALLTHDATPSATPPGFWVTDARFLTLNKPIEDASDILRPERIPSPKPGPTAAPAHPLASPALRRAVNLSRTLKLSDRLDPMWSENARQDTRRAGDISAITARCSEENFHDHRVRA